MFRSFCGREYESELDKDRHEGQCDVCIDAYHGVIEADPPNPERTIHDNEEDWFSEE
jgi:hypothetical protein